MLSTSSLAVLNFPSIFPSHFTYPRQEAEAHLGLNFEDCILNLSNLFSSKNIYRLQMYSKTFSLLNVTHIGLQKNKPLREQSDQISINRGKHLVTLTEPFYPQKRFYLGDTIYVVPIPVCCT